MGSRIKRITLTDFGPLGGKRSFELDGPGTYAIVAPNGKGKSHVVTGVKVATAPNGTLDKPLGAYVNEYGLGEATKASVEVEFDTGGKPLIVSRVFSIDKTTPEEIEAVLKAGGMPKAKSKLSAKFNGEAIRASDDVINLITSLFGIENRVQEDAVFVMQDAAGRLLKEPPSVRSKAIQYLSGAEVCQKAADIAQKRMAMIHVIDRTQEIDTKRNSLATTKASLETSKASLASIPEFTEADHTALTQTIMEGRNGQEAKTRWQQLTSEVNALLAEIGIFSSRLTAIGMQQKVMADKVTPDLQDTAAEAERIVASFQSAKTIAAQRQAVMLQIQALEDEPKQHPEPKLLTTYSQDDLDKWEEDVKHRENTVATSKQFLNLFRETGKCPTCGSAPEDIDNLLKHHTEVSQRHQEVQGLRKKLDSYKADLVKHGADVRAYEQWSEGWGKRVDAAGKQLEGLGSAQDIDEESLKEAQALLAEVADDTVVWNSLKEEQRTLETKVEEKQKRVDEKNAEMAIQAEKAKKASTPEFDQQMVKDASAILDAIAKRAELQGSITAMTTSLEGLQKDLDLLLADQAANEGKLKQIEFLNGIKTVFHHTAVPHDRAIAYLENLNATLAAYGNILHTQFSLYVDPETHNFMVKFGDRIVPAYQLSGGQFTLASWMWHLALYERHGQSVGFIVMDEPTTGLDDKNLQNVAEVVQHLTRYCHGSGLQFLMVTHERDLAAAFERVITL